MKKGHIFLIVAGAIILASGITVYDRFKVEPVVLPNEQRHDEVVTHPPSATPTPPTAVPAQANLSVPFTSQAPHGNWEDPYGEFCEEASTLMAAFYMQDKTIPNADFADAELHKIKDFEINKFGYHLDTTAKESSQILTEYFGIKEVKLLEDPTVNQIKENISAGKLVIVPAAGRLLPNPNFRAPGPLYHMFVIKGYTTDGKFITNDPGTRNGKDFLYNFNDVMNAMHDWNGGDVNNGDKVVIIVG